MIPATDEDHEVSAFYDNMAALQRGKVFGVPALSCSCGFVSIGDTWEEAGAGYDEHLAQGGARP